MTTLMESLRRQVARLEAIRPDSPTLKDLRRQIAAYEWAKANPDNPNPPEELAEEVEWYRGVKTVTVGSVPSR